MAAPALYWSRSDNPDSIYLKNQRQWIQKNFSEYLGGQLHVHKNAAFLVIDEDEPFGERHPREAMLPELVLLLCRLIREKADEGVWKKRQDDCIVVSIKEFQEEMHHYRNRYRAAWSKEYREMEDAKLLKAVISYMKSWMMVDECDGEIVIYPAAGKMIGRYPAEFETKEKNR